MNNNFDWKESLLRLARLNRMCTENRDALSGCDTKEQALALYYKTIDWALERDYPNLAFLRKEFSGMERKGLFIDRQFHGEILDSQQVYVLHNCSGTFYVDLNLTERIIPMIYLANGCNVTIKRKENSVGGSIRVPIYVFGENTVCAKDTEEVVFSQYKMEVIL